MLIIPPIAAYIRHPNHEIDWLLVRTAGWLYVISFGIYLAVHLVRAAWKLDKHQNAEIALLKSIAKVDVERVFPADWREIADKFSTLVSHQISAQFQTTQGTTTWALYDKHCNALCTLAGTMLVASHGVSSHISEAIKKEANPVSRWLEYLKETTTAASYRKEYLTENLMDGQTVVHLLGRIDNVASESAAVCLKCCAKELQGRV
jgi:hypothetical protein